MGPRWEGHSGLRAVSVRDRAGGTRRPADLRLARDHVAEPVRLRLRLRVLHRDDLLDAHRVTAERHHVGCLPTRHVRRRRTRGRSA